MALRFTNILIAFVIVSAFFALPAASEASLIAFDSEIGRSTMSAADSSDAAAPLMAPSSTTKARTVADLPEIPDDPPALQWLPTQSSSNSGAGNASPLSSGVSTPCALPDHVAVLSADSLAVGVCETALVIPTPHLDAMLRPPRA